MSDEIIQVNPIVFGGEGESVHANMMFKLWENPNPSATFPSQTINLSSSDYDYLLLICDHYVGVTTYQMAFIAEKGANIVACYSNAQNSGILVARRYFTYVNDTQYTAGEGAKEQGSATTPTTDNNFLSPRIIYGFKKSLDITAIVSNVSTDATRCIMSDGVTNVETAIYQNAIYSETEHVVGKWIDGRTLYEKTINCGAMPNNTTKSVAHGISNLAKVACANGIADDNSNTFIPIPYLPTSGSTNGGFAIIGTNIRLSATVDLSGFVNTYITIRYTKSS